MGLTHDSDANDSSRDLRFTMGLTHDSDANDSAITGLTHNLDADGSP